jgi:hypothetical protein
MIGPVILAALALASPSVTPYQAASRVTGVTVLCFSHRAWKAVNAQSYGPGTDAGGLYFPRPLRVIGLPRYVCRYLQGWRHLRTQYDPGGWHRSPTQLVADAVLRLGHEATHAEQEVAGKPFDENEAECGASHKFFHVVRALKIGLRFKPSAWRPAPWCAR